MWSIHSPITKAFLFASTVVLCSGCLSSPEKSSKKINAITNLQAHSANAKASQVDEPPAEQKDRCDEIKPGEQHYELCVDRVRDGKTEVESDAVVFEWKEK